MNRGLPDSSVGKESACNAGDPGSTPVLGRSAGDHGPCHLQMMTPVSLSRQLTAVSH